MPDRVVTAELCNQANQQFIPRCVSDSHYDGVDSATDGEIAACVSGFEAFSCSNLCNQVPEDPVACQALDTTPNDNFVECAP